MRSWGFVVNFFVFVRGDPMKKIVDYILFLKTQCDLKISIHPRMEFAHFFSKDLKCFNTHDTSYCSYVKSFPDASRHCVQKQEAVLQKACAGSYCGICYAGVTEFIYPIRHKKETIGFISVSGYQAENAAQYVHAVSRKYGLSEDKLAARYGHLKGKVPKKEEIDVLLHPLCDMIELAMLKQSDAVVNTTSFPELVEQYIWYHHTEALTSKEICRKFNCGRTYLSQSFNQHFGKSIRQYITELRVADAKNLLVHSNLSVTEIAFSVGYSDSNYFSNIFKQKVGLSPMAYRNAFRSV